MISSFPCFSDVGHLFTKFHVHLIASISSAMPRSQRHSCPSILSFHMASLSIPPENLSTAYLRQYGGDSVRNVSYAFIFITIAVVGLRLYARKISNTKYGVDATLLMVETVQSEGPTSPF